MCWSSLFWLPAPLNDLYIWCGLSRIYWGSPPVAQRHWNAERHLRHQSLPPRWRRFDYPRSLSTRWLCDHSRCHFFHYAVRWLIQNRYNQLPFKRWHLLSGQSDCLYEPRDSDQLSQAPWCYCPRNTQPPYLRQCVWGQSELCQSGQCGDALL